jgi:hypothetical protein
MRIRDFIGVKFPNDKQAYFAEVTEVLPGDKLECRFVHTGSVYTFKKYSGWLEVAETTGAFKPGTRTSDVTLYEKTDEQVSFGRNVAVTFDEGHSYLGIAEKTSPTLDIKFLHSGNSYSIDNDNIAHRAGGTYDGRKVLEIKTYAPGKSLFSSDIAHGAGKPIPEGEQTADEQPSEQSEEQPTDSDQPAQQSDDKPADHSDEQGSQSVSNTQFLFVDLYPGDLKKKSTDLMGEPAWDVLINAPHFYGAILKAAQGSKGWSNDHGWFNKNWPLLKTVGGDRYGATWFRGAYLFLNFWQSGKDQADNYLDIIDAAGGWDAGDIIPIIDVELGNDGSNGRPRNRNNDASAKEIIDCTTACADQIRSKTGRQVMLYGRGAMRERSIKSRMGCDIVWNPSYTQTIVLHGLEAWNLDDIALWQYCGDGKAAIDEKKLPRSIDNFGKVDISVYIDGSRKPGLASLLKRLGIGTVSA